MESFDGLDMVLDMRGDRSYAGKDGVIAESGDLRNFNGCCAVAEFRQSKCLGKTEAGSWD